MIRKVFALQLVIAVLMVIVVLSSAYSLVLLLQINQIEWPFGHKAAPGRPAPFADEVMEIMKPLRYSGLSMVEGEDVRLSLDFGKRTWTLHNVHKFDAAGKLVLEDGKYGICGELAAHTYEKIRPLFGGGYDIWFTNCAQSGYFLLPQASSHIILSIRDNSSGRTYVLDPSFRKYGPIEEFENYLFTENLSYLPFVANKEMFVTFATGYLMPVLIRKEHLVGLVVEDNNGAYDENNFVVAVTLTKKHTFAGRYLFALRLDNGRRQVFENRGLANIVFRNGEYDALRGKIEFLFDNAAK